MELARVAHGRGPDEEAVAFERVADAALDVKRLALELADAFQRFDAARSTLRDHGFTVGVDFAPMIGAAYTAWQRQAGTRARGEVRPALPSSGESQ